MLTKLDHNMSKWALSLTCGYFPFTWSLLHSPSQLHLSYSTDWCTQLLVIFYLSKQKDLTNMEPADSLTACMTISAFCLSGWKDSTVSWDQGDLGASRPISPSVTLRAMSLQPSVSEPIQPQNLVLVSAQATAYRQCFHFPVFLHSFLCNHTHSRHYCGCGFSYLQLLISEFLQALTPVWITLTASASLFWRPVPCSIYSTWAKAKRRCH